MVPKNLIAGQQWRNKHREQIYGHEERGGEGETYGKSNIETYIQFSSVAQSCPILQPHEPQHASLPCPSPTLGVHPSTCPSSQ